jgi:hypothetical protein
MLTHFRVFAAAHARQVTAIRRCLGVLSMLALTALGQSCTTAQSSLFTGPDPADARVSVRATSYRSTFGAYVSERPVEPSAWRDLNERVTPAPKQ